MSKDEEIRNVGTRRRNLLYLMERYLQDNGYYQTAQQLKTEARISDELELCDNVDLDAIYLEYASYYHLKFGKYPRMLRKTKQPIKVEANPGRRRLKIHPIKTEQVEDAGGCGDNSSELQVIVKRLETDKTEPAELKQLQEIEHPTNAINNPDELLGGGDWQQLADLVRTTIMREDIKLSWNDIFGNQKAIAILKEAVVTPIKYPHLFSQGLKPWKSVLLHGPPGTGKTLLARILYAETRRQVTFFNVTSSVAVSKWRGESEKILRVLFYFAHKYQPSIIFFDEIEGLTSRRDRPTDHESSKRFKNELLQLLDGLEQQMSGIFILASTNLPWDIDDAFLRRFEKKLLVQLPNSIERQRIIERLLPLQIRIDEQQMEDLLKLSENFTGDEIRLACKEIAMLAIRRITAGTKNDEAAGAPHKEIQHAFRQIRPLSLKLMPRHELWQTEHGS